MEWNLFKEKLRNLNFIAPPKDSRVWIVGALPCEVALVEVCAWILNNEVGLPQNNRISIWGVSFETNSDGVLCCCFVIGFAMSCSGEMTASGHTCKHLPIHKQFHEAVPSTYRAPISFISRFMIFCSVRQTLLQCAHLSMVLTKLYVNGQAEEAH